MHVYGKTHKTSELEAIVKSSDSPISTLEVSFKDRKTSETRHANGSVTTTYLRSTMINNKKSNLHFVKVHTEAPRLTEKELSCLRLKVDVTLGGLALVPVGMVAGAVATFGATAVATAWLGVLVIGSLTVGVAECRKITNHTT